MKKILTLFLILPIIIYSQSSEKLTLNYPYAINVTKAGSCCSPDGPINEIGSPPIDYQFLEDNGYCNYTYFTTSGFTACFTMTSPGTDISFNAGFSSSCGNVQFNNFNLYDASCTLIGAGLSFSGLTPGSTYTWCLDMRAFGGPFCNGFDNFCPYYIDNTVGLPVTLIGFKSKCGIVEWTTESEINNDYFLLEYSLFGTEWYLLDTIPGAGNSNEIRNYYYFDNQIDIIKYYRLAQVNYDGEKKYYSPVIMNCPPKIKYIISVYDILGRPANLKSKGILIIRYNNGEIKKIIKNE